MNTTTTRVAKYAGAGLAGIATTCVLAAPALAMRPDPTPGSGQHNVYDSCATRGCPSDTSLGARDGQASTPASRVGASSSHGVNWSTLVAGFGGGAMLTGVAVLGAAQLHRRQTRPA